MVSSLSGYLMDSSLQKKPRLKGLCCGVRMTNGSPTVKRKERDRWWLWMIFSLRYSDDPLWLLHHAYDLVRSGNVSCWDHTGTSPLRSCTTTELDARGLELQQNNITQDLRRDVVEPHNLFWSCSVFLSSEYDQWEWSQCLSHPA